MNSLPIVGTNLFALARKNEKSLIATKEKTILIEDFIINVFCYTLFILTCSKNLKSRSFIYEAMDDIIIG